MIYEIRELENFENELISEKIINGNYSIGSGMYLISKNNMIYYHIKIIDNTNNLSYCIDYIKAMENRFNNNYTIVIYCSDKTLIDSLRLPINENKI